LTLQEAVLGEAYQAHGVQDTHGTQSYRYPGLGTIASASVSHSVKVPDSILSRSGALTRSEAKPKFMVTDCTSLEKHF